MKKLFFILILFLPLFVENIVAQCVVAVGSNQSICQGSATTGLGGSLSGGATTAVWTVGGLSGVFSNPNELNSTWTPPVTYSGTAVLTLTVNDGGICNGTSATVSIIVTPSVLATVSIAGDANPVCSGTLVTYTATSANGGTTPHYQWKVNGTNSGGDIPSFSYTPSNNDEVTCLLTSNAACATISPVTSNVLTIIVNPSLPVSIAISTGTTTVCAGTTVTYTATPNNGGTTPHYQWKVNGTNSGSDIPSFSYTPSNNDEVACLLTSNAVCATGSPVTSNVLTMIVNPSLPVSIVISTGTTTVCAGTSVAYTAAPNNGGATPRYQWKVNGANSGSDSPSFSYTPSNNDKVTCLLTSNASCATGSLANSNEIIMTVNTNLPASVSIAAVPSGAICSGASVSFTASPTNGGTPTYQWFKNTGLVGSGSNYSYIPTNGDQLYAVMTSSLSCVTGSPATSNPLTISLLPNSNITLSSGGSSISQTVCRNSGITNITYNTTGATGASFSGLPSGVNGLWSANVVTISGTPSVAGPFNYTVTLTGGCGNVSTNGSITVTPIPVATFSYTGTPYCSNGSNPSPTFSGGGVAGTFASTSGLVFVSALTGQVNLAASSPGTYTVTNSISAGAVCGAVSANTQITITALPIATISYSGSPWCGSVGVQPVSIVGPIGGTFYANPATGLNLNTGNGAITPAGSTASNYTVYYNIPATGGCLSYPTPVSVTISPTPTAPTFGLITQPGCAPGTGSVVLNGLPTGNWSVTRTPGAVVTSGSTTSAVITNLPSGTYTFTVANAAGCTSVASANVIINAAISLPAIPVQTHDCSLGFNHATVTVTSPVGAGLQYTLIGSLVTYPYQSSPLFSNVINDSYYITVKNSSGCEKSGVPFSVSCGCVNGPTVTLSSLAGGTCGITPVTVTGNSYSGSATSVTISSNGAGILNPSSSAVTPFSFTYTPNATDAGKVVLITVATNNPLGSPCAAGVAIYILTINAIPPAPVVGTIVPPTCSLGTGSVNLNGLPSTGTWTLTRNPGAIITTGSGTTTTVMGLVPGTYSFIVASADGCVSASSANVVITTPPSAPSAPVIGTITQPTCANSTGSVTLSGLPATGTWSLTRSPGAVTINGTGTTTTILSLPAGVINTFSVTNSTGCISPPSGNVVINFQPSIPPAPIVGTITAPTCALPTGGVVLTGLPATGSWTIIRYPGTISTTGTGTSTTIAGLIPGTFNFTVTTADGCLSGPSLNVIIPVPPAIPAAPVIGIITQPTLTIPSGSVVLNGLPSGSWVITRLPGAVTTAGTGTSKTISNLPGGVFTFKVTNSTGCTSTESNSVTIATPGIPTVLITDPPAVCSPNTVDITSTDITAGSAPDLIYTYWTDSGATISFTSPKAATEATYYIKGTAVSGYFSIKPVKVTVDKLPVANAGADQVLVYQFSTTMDGSLAGSQTGIWMLLSGTGELSDAEDPKTHVSGLSSGDNGFLWTVKSGVCPVVSDSVSIIVQNLVIPTLITPNMDGRNDYFILNGLSTLGGTELVIFDRRGAEVYKNMNYDNTWNGVDFNNKPLPDDTYFYVIKAQHYKPLSGYIVIIR
jgi:gliding motility-associated-like protein